MRLDLTFTEYFAQPIEEVWRAITDRRMLAAWLNENDFEARLGARFTLHRSDPPPGGRGWVECVVLELREPTRMVWSWSDGEEEGEPTRVTFELRTEGAGTRLDIRHVGDESDAAAKMTSERWPVKLRALITMLGRKGSTRGPSSRP